VLKLFELGIACTLELHHKLFERILQRFTEPALAILEPGEHLRLLRQRQVKTYLEAPPDRPIEKLRMVCRGHDQHVAGQIVDLEEQRAEDSLDLPRVVLVSAFFAESVELIEKKHTGAGPGIVEESPQANGSLTEVAANDSLVADDDQG